MIKLILVAFLMLAPLCESAIYYVSKTGSDLNDGITTETAFLTIQKGLNTVATGDTLSVGPGLYEEEPTSKVDGYTLIGAGAGSTTIYGDTRVTHANVTIDGITWDGFASGVLISGGLLPTGSGCSGLLVRNCEFKRGRGIACDDGPGPTYPGTMTVRSNDFHHLIVNGAVALLGDNHIVENNVFRDSVNDALRLLGANHIFRSNYFTRIYAPADAGMNATSTTSIEIGTGDKVFTVGSGKNFTPGYRVTACSDAAPTVDFMTGFVTDYDGTSLTIQVYTFGGSGTHTDWVITTGPLDTDWAVDPILNGNHSDLIQVFDGTQFMPTTGIVFAHNLSEDCTGQFGNLENNPENTEHGDWLISNNIFNRSRIQLNNYIPNVKVIHNTFYQTGQHTTGIAARLSGGVKGEGINMEVKNNLFIYVGTTVSATDGFYSIGTSGSVAEGNIVIGTDGFLKTVGAGNWSGVEYLPDFTDAANGDFHYTTASWAYNRGVDVSSHGITTDFYGTTRTTSDIGAVAVTVEVPPPTPARRARISGGVALHGGTIQ